MLWPYVEFVNFISLSKNSKFKESKCGETTICLEQKEGVRECSEKLGIISIMLCIYIAQNVFSA